MPISILPQDQNGQELFNAISFFTNLFTNQIRYITLVNKLVRSLTKTTNPPQFMSNSVNNYPSNDIPGRVRFVFIKSLTDKRICHV